MTSKFLTPFVATDGAYQTDVKAYRAYETDKHNAPRDAINASFGILTGRNFSEFLQWKHWSIREISELQYMRFNNGEYDVIGRDIIIKEGISEDMVREMIAAYNRANSAAINFESYDQSEKLEFAFTIWKTSAGKRTRYGRPSDGNMVERIKIHYHSKGKRNRKTLGF